MPSIADLRIYQGDNYHATVDVAYDDGSPLDLTGYTAQAQIRRGPADSTTLLAEAVCTIMSPTQVRVEFSSAATSALNGDYWWDLQVISPAGYVTTILAGKVKATPEVTRNVALSLRRTA